MINDKYKLEYEDLISILNICIKYFEYLPRTWRHAAQVDIEDCVNKIIRKDNLYSIIDDNKIYFINRGNKNV